MHYNPLRRNVTSDVTARQRLSTGQSSAHPAGDTYTPGNPGGGNPGSGNPGVGNPGGGNPGGGNPGGGNSGGGNRAILEAKSW